MIFDAMNKPPPDPIVFLPPLVRGLRSVTLNLV